MGWAWRTHSLLPRLALGSTQRCAWHFGVKILGWANKFFSSSNLFCHGRCVHLLKDFSWLSLKSNKRLTKISILTPWCAVWLCGGMHTAELDSMLQWHVDMLTCGAFWEILITWLRVVMHTVELDLAVGFTLQSSTLQWDAHRRVRLVQICHFFVFSYLLRFSTQFLRKNFELKKILKQLVTYYFHINIFRHHREIAFVKHRIKTDTW